MVCCRCRTTPLDRARSNRLLRGYGGPESIGPDHRSIDWPDADLVRPSGLHSGARFHLPAQRGLGQQPEAIPILQITRPTAQPIPMPPVPSSRLIFLACGDPRAAAPVPHVGSRWRAEVTHHLYLTGLRVQARSALRPDRDFRTTAAGHPLTGRASLHQQERFLRQSLPQATRQ